MGAWGNKIYQNDTAMDVKDSYKKLLQDGKSTEEAYEEMFESYSDVLSSEYVDDIIIFYLSFADTLWNYGRLTNELKEAALKIISELSRYTVCCNELYGSSSVCLVPI